MKQNHVLSLNWCLISALVIILCLQFLQSKSLASGPGGLDGGSYSFCGASIVDYKTDINKISGYDKYATHLEKIKKLLPTLALNLSLIEDFDWYYFPIKRNGKSCRFKQNSGKDVISGMEKMGVSVEQPINFNKKAKQIYVREDLFSKQKDKGLQLLNEAVRNLCTWSYYEDSDLNVCVTNSRAVLDKIDKYKTGDEVIVQLLLRPFSIIEKDKKFFGHYIVGYSDNLKNIAIEMGRNKSSTLEELKTALKQSYNNFKLTNNCTDEPTLSFEYKNTIPIWSCLIQIEESGFLKKNVINKLVTFEDENIGFILKTKQSENNIKWEKAIEIIKKLDSKKQILEKISNFYEQILYIDLNMYQKCRIDNLDSCTRYWYRLDEFSFNLDYILNLFDYNIKSTNEFVRELESQ